MTSSRKPKHPFTSNLVRDCRIRLDALITRACAVADRDEPVTIHDMMDLYELSARLELLIETLDARRRMRIDRDDPRKEHK